MTEMGSYSHILIRRQRMGPGPPYVRMLTHTQTHIHIQTYVCICVLSMYVCVWIREWPKVLHVDIRVAVHYASAMCRHCIKFNLLVPIRIFN